MSDVAAWQVSHILSSIAPPKGSAAKAVFQLTFNGYPNPSLRIMWSVIPLVSSDTGKLTAFFNRIYTAIDFPVSIVYLVYIVIRANWVNSKEQNSVLAYKSIHNGWIMR